MRSATVVLAGKAYTVQRLPAMRAIQWRKRAQQLLDAFPAIQEIYERETENLVKASAEVYRAANGAVEALVEVVLDADPGLAADRDFILDNAMEDEFLTAFQGVMLLNAPLSGTMG